MLIGATLASLLCIVLTMTGGFHRTAHEAAYAVIVNGTQSYIRSRFNVILTRSQHKYAVCPPPPPCSSMSTPLSLPFEQLRPVQPYSLYNITPSSYHGIRAGGSKFKRLFI